MRVIQDPLALVNTFVTDLTNFLVAEDVGIRDVARDALGMELNSRLYPHLLRLLNE
jgi:neurofibromin 1